MTQREFRHRFYIITDNGVWYNSEKNALEIPHGMSFEDALQGCVITGKIELWEDDGYLPQIREEGTFTGSISINGTSEPTDNPNIEVAFGNVSFYTSGGKKYFRIEVLPNYNNDYSIYCPAYDSYDDQLQHSKPAIYSLERKPLFVSIDEDHQYMNKYPGDEINLVGATITCHYEHNYTYNTYINALQQMYWFLFTMQCNGQKETSPVDGLTVNSKYFKDEPNEVVCTLRNLGSFVIYVAVTYYEPSLIVSYSSSMTGTPESPIFVGDDGVTLNKTGFAAFAKRHNNAFGNKNIFTNSVVTETVTSDVDWGDDDSFTKQQVEEMGGDGYDITLTYEYDDDFEQTITYEYVTVFLAVLAPISASIDGSDEVARYYLYEDSYFVTPTFTFEDSDYPYIFSYNDGSSSSIAATDVYSTEVVATASSEAQALVANTSVIGPNVTTLYLRITLVNGDVAYAPFLIHRKSDKVTSITPNGDFIFYLGNKLSTYKGNSFQVAAEWENPLRQDDTNFLDYTIANDVPIMTSGALDSSISISTPTNNLITSIDTTGITISYVAPNVKEIQLLTATGLRPSYQNELDMIDLSNVRIKILYENTDYTRTAAFSDTNQADADEFSVTVLDNSSDPATVLFPDSLDSTTTDIDYLNGVNAVSVLNTQAVYYCEFQFNVYNEFKQTTSGVYSYPFLITTLTEITGIRIKEAFRDYKVGDKFLQVKEKNSDNELVDKDLTVVTLFYDGVDGGGTIYHTSVDVYLKDDVPTISTNYVSGTQWTQPDSSKRIVVSSVFDNTINAEYTIQVTYDGYVTGSKTHNLVVVWQPYIEFEDGTVYGNEEEPNGLLVIYDEDDTTVENDIRTVTNPDAKPKGYIKHIFDTKVLDSQAVMVLLDDYIPPIDGSPNVVIEFPSYSGLAENINKCTFGILFGNNNANNRLFVSGNPDVRNADWHSGETNVIHTEGEANNVNGDFSYFPNEYVMYYGETDNKVIGYDIVSNDKLFVLKDKSDKEKTVYFRTPTLVTALDATGATVTDVQGNTLYQEEFALVKGNNSVAGVSPHSIINLNGDTLFVDSDNTLQGLDLTGIVGDNQRYANTRSKYLDNVLKDYDLSKTFLWTNNKYLFMPVKNVGLFVTHTATQNAESKQYEWWKLQSEEPTCFIEIDNSIYFGNSKGELFKMKNGEYCDEYKIFINEGQGVLARIHDSAYEEEIDDVLLPPECVIVSEDIFNKMFPEDNPYYDDSGKQIRHLYFRSINTGSTYLGSAFYQIGSICNESNEQTYDNVDFLIKKYDGVSYLEVAAIVDGEFNEERQLKLYQMLQEQREYYLNFYQQGGVQKVYCKSGSVFENNYNNKYRLVYVPSDFNDRYLMEVYNKSSEQWENADLEDLYNANLVSKLEGDYEVCSVDSDSCSFKLKNESGEIMDLVRYGRQDYVNEFQAEIIEKKDVVSYYITAPFTMGKIDYFKTIWSFTFTNDTGKPSAYDLAIASNKIPYVSTKDIASISKAKIGTNFSDFTFEAVDFDKNIVPRTYTIQRTMGMQKFVCFAFKNGDNSNCILSSLSVVYTLPFPSYGSD